MVSSSPPPCPPSSAAVGYSKIGSTSFCSSHSPSEKLGNSGNGDLQRNKLKAFCLGVWGRALACAVAAVGICLLVVLLLQDRHSHYRGGNIDKPSPSESPLTTPTVAPAPSTDIPPPPSTVPAQALSLSSLCNSTDQSALCLTTLSRYPSQEPTAALQDLTAYVAGKALSLVNQTLVLAKNLSKSSNGSRGEHAALQDCLELLDQAKDGLNDSINRLSHLDLHAQWKGQVMDVQVWMSSSYTDQDTCLTGFDEVEGSLKDQMMKAGQPIAPLIDIALSFAGTLKDEGISALYALRPTSPP